MTRKIGRPKGSGKFTNTLANEILRLLESGLSLREVCKRDDIPVSHGTVLAWRDDSSLNVISATGEKLSFSDQYARARELSYRDMMDRMLAVATDCEASNAEVQKARLICDVMKWTLARALPKLYGDRVNLEHTGADGGAIKSENIDPRDLARSVLDVLAEAGEAFEIEVLPDTRTRH